MIPKVRQRNCHDILRDGMRYLDSDMEQYRLEGRQLLFIGVRSCESCSNKEGCKHYTEALERLQA